MTVAKTPSVPVAEPVRFRRGDIVRYHDRYGYVESVNHGVADVTLRGAWSQPLPVKHLVLVSKSLL